MQPKSKLSNWFEKKFAEWQPAQPRGKRSLRAFALYLNVSKSSLDNWINGRSKAMFESTARQIAEKLGDEIYDLTGLPRPDPDLRRIEALWPTLKEESRAYIVSVAEKRAGDGQASETAPRVVAKARQATA